MGIDIINVFCTNNTTYMNFLALTRTYSSRMHTIRCSGWGVSASGVSVQGDVCLEGCLPGGGMSSHGGVCPGGCLPQFLLGYTPSCGQNS